MLEPRPIREPRSNEEIFFEFYPRLLQWAIQLTRHDREDAEDLVHDLYIRFTRIQSVLDHVDCLESYLFSMLRNLNYARLRRAGRNPIKDLSLVEFESFERGLAAIDRRGLLFARADLRKICEYACQRRHTSRSASLLILRFFFGYYPSELMKVVQMKRSAVDKALQVARKEARLFLERPSGIRCIAPHERAPMVAAHLPDDACALFQELRLAIFSTCEGECFSEETMADRYRHVPPSGFTMAELAHLAGCRSCLDQANRILGLPLLAERSPFDALDRDTPSGPDGSGGAGQAGPSRKRPARRTKPLGDGRSLERKAREVYEHRPQSLQIAVNGDIRTSQTVTAEISELHLKLDRAEMPGFIEVLSEQEICLAYLQVRDPSQEASLSQTETIHPSDGRTLDLTLSFAGDQPLVHVVYHDPVMAEDADAEASPSPVDEQPQLVLILVEPAEKRPATEREPTLLALLSKWQAWVAEKFFDGPLGYATLLTVLALVGLSFLVRNDQTSPSPAELLQRAAAVENAAVPGQALHRVIDLAGLGQTGAPESTQRVEIWSDAESGKLARRLYGDHGTLLATELSAPASGTTIYRKGRTLNSGPVSLAGVTPEDAWRLAPSASEMEKAQSALPDRSVTSTAHAYIIDARQPQAGAQDLVEASLTLRRSDLRPTEETLTFREADGLHRVRLVEAVYERVPLREVAPGVFLPDREFLPPRRGRRNQSLLIHPLGPVAPEMAVRVLYRLSQVGADLGGQTQITRLPHGGLSVTGTLDSAVEKAEVLRALAGTRGMVEVHVNVNGEPGKMKHGTGRTHLELVEPGADVIPADALLRKMLAAKGVPSAQMDEAVRDFSLQTTRLSLNARMQAWALSSALKLLSPQEVRRLSPEGRQEWLAIVTRHAAALGAALEDLRIELTPLREAPSGTTTAAPAIDSVEDMTASSAQILALVDAQDEAIRAALTLSAQAHTGSTQSFEPPEFWQSMDRLTAFSTSVQQTSQTLEAAARSPQAR